MPEIDVSDLLTDSFIAGSSLIVYRRQQVVNGYGETVDGSEPIAIVGAVYPTGENSLTRAEAYSTQTETISVVSQFPLQGPGKDEQGRMFDADVVGWKGNYYVVETVNSFEQYGAGFVKADCSAVSFNVARTTPQPGV